MKAVLKTRWLMCLVVLLTSWATSVSAPYVSYVDRDEDTTALEQTLPLDSLATISAAEMSSPMMTDATATTYSQSWLSTMLGWYDSYPLLTLCGLIVLVGVVAYVVKKIAIAMI